MNFQHLRSFVAVQKHMSYTRAARDVFLSQPAVSRHIRQLEEALKVRLFDQIGKTLYLTDAGQTLAKEAEKILGTIDRAVEAVSTHRNPTSGNLRIGASTTPGLYLLPHLLGSFRDRFPDVDVQLSVENSERVERMLVRNELDLGFVGEPLSDSGIEMEAIAKDEIVCFASPGHPLAERRKIPAGALTGETWIIREKGSATRSLFDSWLASAPTKPGKTMVFRSCEEAKLLVEAGIGISLMSTLGLSQDIASGRFKKLRISDLHLKRSIYLAKHVDKHTSPTMAVFMEMARTWAGIKK